MWGVLKHINYMQYRIYIQKIDRNTCFLFNLTDSIKICKGVVLTFSAKILPLEYTSSYWQLGNHGMRHKCVVLIQHLWERSLLTKYNLLMNKDCLLLNPQIPKSSIQYFHLSTKNPYKASSSFFLSSFFKVSI